MDFDEKRLVALARRGDKKAFSELYNHYANELFLFLRSRSRNREDALDLASEVFIRVLRYLSSFRGDSSFRTWLYRIARNLLVDYYTANARAGSLHLEEEQWLNIGTKDESPADDQDEKQHEAEIENSQEVKVLQGILDKLPENYREILELRDLMNFSYAECAEAMDIKEDNAKVMHLRALRYAKKISANLNLGNDDEKPAKL